ncbi:hypothetical protein NL676_000434 [Syzygium grande]|nr:hypothetical protein NL676_000434 [Syzygium grande]
MSRAPSPLTKPQGRSKLASAPAGHRSMTSDESRNAEASPGTRRGAQPPTATTAARGRWYLREGGDFPRAAVAQTETAK